MEATSLGIGIAVVIFVALAVVLIRKVNNDNEQRTSDSPKITSETTAPLTEVRDDALEAAEADPSVTVQAEQEATLLEGLDRTRSEGFLARMSRLFASKSNDESVLDELEELLLTADIGVQTASRLFERIRSELSPEELQDYARVLAVIRSEAEAILAGTKETGINPSANGPRVIMVLGVNGAGKTTSIGKLAARFKAEGKSVLLVAGDTFRAAAAEQLEQWGQRVDADVTRGAEGADPASVVFDGLKTGTEQGVDIILVDTAGRLHTQKNLMAELTKVHKVMSKAVDHAPHEVLLVVDATTGQNAIQQAKTFREATQVTGIVLTKLDGTAKGGVVLGVCDELGIPIQYVGIGERVADLKTFDAAEFVDALFHSAA